MNTNKHKANNKVTRLIMMSGLSASGKSTVAESLLTEVYPDSVRVNKDLLRKMLHFGEYSWQNEKLVDLIEKTITRDCLENGIDVIVDDTNLQPYHENKWTTIAQECGALFIKATQTTDWEECIDRDEQRARDGKDSVGADVIKKQAMETGRVKGDFVICDLDGTLCDITDRRHLVDPAGGEKNWKEFFANIPNDKLREDVAEQVRQLSRAGMKIVYLSGRPEEHKQETLEWLARHGMDFNFTLIMRKIGDRRPDTQVKLEMLNKYFPNREQIIKVIDDRPCVVRMWQEELGKDRVQDVGDGTEF